MLATSAIPKHLVDEGERVMRLCNACRYCEGYCAVFPAMERRLTFGEKDLEYLANLCHNCGECFYACQYAPPQEFDLNFPRTLAELRAATYRKYARPAGLAQAFARNGTLVAVVSIAAVLGFAAALVATGGSGFTSAHTVAAGSFHALMGHGAMVAVFGVACVAVGLALAASVVAYWRSVGRVDGTRTDRHALAGAIGDILRLRYLDGGGEGCTYPAEESSHGRRWMHHLTFYGFLSCFASTSLAALYHYGFGWQAPYPVTSLPVLLGTVGGVSLVVGALGLLWLKAFRDPALTDPRQTGMDVAFLVLVASAAASGLILLAVRETSAMGVMLALHLGLVLALFVTMPYGKFVHGIYRAAALLRHAVETRSMPRLGAE